MTARPYIFPTSVVLMQCTEVFPLPPHDYDGTFSLGLDIHFSSHYAKANQINPIAVVMSGADEPNDYGLFGSANRSLPLPDIELMRYLFKTCDVCKDYLVNSHREETLTSHRVYARNVYKVLFPVVEDWQPDHADIVVRDENNLWNHKYQTFLSTRQFCDVFPSGRGYESVIRFCKRCQGELLSTVSSQEVFLIERRYQSLARTFRQSRDKYRYGVDYSNNHGVFTSWTGNDEHRYSSNILFVTLDMDEARQRIEDMLSEMQSRYLFVRVKRAITAPGISQCSMEEDMDQDDETQIVPYEDTQSLSQEESDPLSEFERELADY